MATLWVLLHRTVGFIDGTGAATIGGVRSPAEAMASMKPATSISEPPEVSYLSILRHTPSHNTGGIHDGEISSTDGGLAVLYTSSYHPGNGGFSGAGCYLVYDASTASVSTIPRSPTTRPSRRPPSTASVAAPPSCATAPAGTFSPSSSPRTTAHSPTRNSTCGRRRRHRPPRTLPPAAGGPRRRCACRFLPRLCGPNPAYSFEIDLAFPLAESSRVCWVDLLAGVLVCDLLVPDGPEFSFVLLPASCRVDTPVPNARHGAPEQLRSMAASAAPSDSSARTNHR
ncbi:unnamed protein product [Urochloa humidicola]